MSEVSVSDNTEAHRFEARVGDDSAVAGFVVYERRPDEVELVHTEVDDAYEGQGVGSALARGALDAIRAEGLPVVPTCEFIAGWIDKHPDYADLVRG